MNPAPDQALDTDTIAASLWARISAMTDLGSKTASLAMSELKLATSSAAIAIGVAIFLALMLLTLWSLLLVLGFFLLRYTGMSAMLATTVLLFIQTAGCAALGLVLKQLVSQMRFVNTRRAMREKLSDDAPSTNPI